MPPDLPPLFDLADARLHWLGARQEVLAQNIANANTPHYVAKDVDPFGDVLASAGAALVRTNPMHLAGWNESVDPPKPQARAEHSLDGNSVRLDEELTKIADTDEQQALVTNLYHAYLGLFRTALGK